MKWASLFPSSAFLAVVAMGNKSKRVSSTAVAYKDFANYEKWQALNSPYQTAYKKATTTYYHYHCLVPRLGKCPFLPVPLVQPSQIVYSEYTVDVEWTYDDRLEMHGTFTRLNRFTHSPTRNDITRRKEGWRKEWNILVEDMKKRIYYKLVASHHFWCWMWV